jgi:hypothetical protein
MRHLPIRKKGKGLIVPGKTKSDEVEAGARTLEGVDTVCTAPSRIPVIGLHQLLPSNWKTPDALSGGGEDGVRDRRRSRGQSGIATKRSMFTVNDPDIDFWSIPHPGNPVVIIVALFNSPVLKGDFLAGCDRDAPNDTSFNLRFQGVRIHMPAHINGAIHSVNHQFAPLAHRNFGDFSTDTSRKVANRNAPAVSFRKRTAPVRIFCHKLQNLFKPWAVP